MRNKKTNYDSYSKQYKNKLLTVASYSLPLYFIILSICVFSPPRSSEKNLKLRNVRKENFFSSLCQRYSVVRRVFDYLS